MKSLVTKQDLQNWTGDISKSLGSQQWWPVKVIIGIGSIIGGFIYGKD